MKRPHTILWLFVLVMSIFGRGFGQWIRQPTPWDINFLLTVDFSNNNLGIAGGWYNVDTFRGRIINTTNGGINWTSAQIPESTRSIVTLTFSSPDIAYAAGAYNLTTVSQYNSTSARDQREYSSSYSLAIGMKQYLHRIGFVGSDNYSGIFLTTTNGGKEWFTKGTLPDSIYYLLGASFINTKIGYLTADAHPQSGIACILKTTNGGETWIRLSTTDSISSLRNIMFTDALTGNAVGFYIKNQTANGIILRTGNGGETWQLQEFPYVNNFTDVFFVDSFTGFAVGVSQVGSGAIYKTTDAGINWSLLNYQPQNVLLNGVRFAKGSITGVIYGNEDFYPFIARTTDGGSTWIEGSIANNVGEKLLVGGKLLTPLTGYLCGGDFTTSAVMLYTNNGGVTAVQREDEYTSEHYLLSQNFPNPFNPNTIIHFSLPQASYVSLKVLNILGQEVSTLVSGELRAGNFEAEWNANGFTTGVYFYQLRAGAFTETKKLVLVR